MAANTYANLQDGERSAEYAARAVAVDPTDPMVLYNVACLYSVLGRPEDSLTALEDAVNRGWGDKTWLEHDSDLDAIREHPRYRALIAAM
jgi:adenylate cyclase